MGRIVLILAVSIICIAAGNGGGGHRQLSLIPDEGILNEIGEKSEIFQQSALQIMASRRGEPTDTNLSCSSPSAKWLHNQISKLSEEDVTNFFDWHIHSLPFAYKIYIERRGMFDREYFGQTGEYTQEIKSIHAKAQNFWSYTGVDDDIEVLCAHGSDLSDRSNLIQTLEVMFSSQYTDEYTIHDHATDIQELIERLPGGYDYPLLSFNAFATKAKEEMGIESSIIIGEGYFTFQEAVGLASEGPEYALTHEHSHHLQFALDYGKEYIPSQHSERRDELAADALAAYFLAHDDCPPLRYPIYMLYHTQLEIAHSMMMVIMAHLVREDVLQN